MGRLAGFNPATDKYTTISNHPGDMPEGTLKAILRQAGVAAEQFLKGNRGQTTI